MSDYEIEQRYREMLDDSYGDVDICGYEYAASNALQAVDPTAYRCGFADYTSEYTEIEGEYYDTDAVEELVELLQQEEE